MKRIGSWLAPVAAAIGGVVLAGTLAAQDVTVYATAGVDGNHTNVELIGGSARLSNTLGLAPEIGVQGYHVGYDVNNLGNQDLWVVEPSIGLSYRMAQGQVGAHVGYSFQNKNDVVPVGAGVASGSGVTLAAQGNYWGPGLPELQAITSYNFGSDYTWNEARALFNVAALPPGRVSVGPEVVWEGSTRSGGNHAFEVGPDVQYSSGHNWSVGAGAGYKAYSGTGAPGNTWYAKIDFVRYGIHLGFM